MTLTRDLFMYVLNCDIFPNSPPVVNFW